MALYEITIDGWDLDVRPLTVEAADLEEARALAVPLLGVPSERVVALRADRPTGLSSERTRNRSGRYAMGFRHG